MAFIPKGKWSIRLEDDIHIVRAERNFWERVIIYLDDKLIYDTFSLDNVTFRFSVNGHQFSLKEKGFIDRCFVLIVDGIEYESVDKIIIYGQSDEIINHTLPESLQRGKIQDGSHRLRELIGQHFDDSELRNLCFDINVDYDDLPGETKADKCRELIAYFERRTRMPALLKELKTQRPGILWHEIKY